MKPSHGWMVFTAVLAVIAYWMVFSGRHSEAPPEYAALELARADFPNTPSCYSLRTVLEANDLVDGRSEEKILWTMRVPGEWHLRLQRGSAWREYWFTEESGLVVPFQYITSDDADKTTAHEAVDKLLAVAQSKGAPKSARCAQTN
jgi:hypothetical protein